MTLGNNTFQTEVVAPNGYRTPLNTGLFINNEFVAGPTAIDTINPSTGKVITSVQAAEAEHVNMAVDAAEKAFYGGWKTSSPRERARLMHKLADLLERDAEDIVHLEALDNGKPVTACRLYDASLCVDIIRYFAGFCDNTRGTVIETEGKLSYTVHEPIGVCAGILPWNIPTLLMAYKLGPALATGNTIVIKTSELSPLSALKMASLVCEAGFPPGVVNIITGLGPIAGDALARHTKVGMISFTGSVPAGRSVMKASAESNLKKVTLELGGKSPSIIFDDVQNVDEVVRWMHSGTYTNAGQFCCASSRVYVQEGIYDEFLEKFKSVTLSTKIGDPVDPDTFQGPQVSEAQFKRVLEYIDIGKKEGATCYVGGNRVGDTGYFIEPTIFTDVTQEMKIMQEEIFGPVVCICKFKEADDAIRMANDTKYGLAAGVFTSNISRAITVSNALQAGVLWVNCYNIIPPNAPFGGYKLSGTGCEGSEYVLAHYTEVKSIKINIA